MEPAQPEPTQAATPAPEPRTPALQARLRKQLPWLSLLIGITSALSMERGPRRGALVACAAAMIWLFLLTQQWLARRERPTQRWGARLLLVGQRSTLMATQSLLQLTLFFAAPFFVRAAELSDPGHGLFLSALLLLSGATLWDPWTEWLLTHPRVGAFVPAFGSFAALCAVLPGLGLSTRASLWIAAWVASSGSALVYVANLPSGQRWKALPRAAAIASALPLALALGLTRIIPAAPLRLATIDFGSGLANHTLTDVLHSGAEVPPKLYCATAIAAPLGVRDRLFHVWQKDGQANIRIELEIRGGREAGYRTASRIQPGAHAQGVYRCSVVSLNGQVLGSKRIELRARTPEAAHTP